ncbi:MAG: hypothetical protein H7Y02_09100 [Candidatus Obscuribacterales bacterium]|nr:hypothetical protein [Steroidobacteraceae bacterium]
MLVYGVASLLHFTHNAVFLLDYPNMPPTLTSLGVYGAFGVVAAVGLVGYLLYRSGQVRTGLIVIGIYAALGFGGLDHYVVAPLSAHTMMMNLTIMVEVATATVLLVVVVRLFLQRKRSHA